MPADARSKILYNQATVWGDGETRWHLGRFQQQCSSSGLIILDPLLALGWLSHSDTTAVLSWLAKAPATQTIATCLLHQGHWTPVLWVDKVSHFEIHVWDHESVDLRVFDPLHKLVCHCMKLPSYELATTSRPFAAQQLVEQPPFLSLAILRWTYHLASERITLALFSR